MTNQEEILQSQGWKTKKDSTLKSLTKEQLIDEIRCLEHNWAGEINSRALQSNRYWFTKELFKEVIKDIKSYKPEYKELDFDCDDEPYYNYFDLDIDYLIRNILEIRKIDEPYEELLLFGNIGFGNRFLNDRDGFVDLEEGISDKNGKI